MNKQQGKLETLTNRRAHLERQLKDAKEELDRAQARYENVATRLLENEADIAEFKRECFNSPNLDVLPIESRIRKSLKESGIVTIYDLRYALRKDNYIAGVGDLNKNRLKIMLRMFDEQVTEGQTTQ